MLVSNDVQKTNDVRSTIQSLENSNFTFNLLLLNRFQDFDNAFCIRDDIHTFEDFTILPSSNLPDNFIVILTVPEKTFEIKIST